MALSNYDDLRDSILAWSKRDDIDLLVDDFITLAENEFYNNPVEPLSVREIEARAELTASTTSRFLALPSGFNSARKFAIISSDGVQYDLTYMPPEMLNVRDDTGQPLYFTITSQIEFDITPEEEYTVIVDYLQQSPALTSTATTNEILTNYPNIYLYGALHQVFLWAEEDDELQKYQQKFVAAIQGANKNDWLGRYGPAPFMRIEGDTP